MLKREISDIETQIRLDTEDLARLRIRKRNKDDELEKRLEGIHQDYLERRLFRDLHRRLRKLQDQTAKQLSL